MVLPGMELLNCPSLAVPKDVMHHVVRVESSYNPYAIGVVGGKLARQPKTLPEALATVRMLEAKGYNFSLGLAQVNRYNLEKYGLASYEQAFEVCPNLQTGSRILAECYGRSGGNWGKSFSCYYSGNFVTGYRHGYVQKIYASMRGRGAVTTDASEGASIAVSGNSSRRVVEVTHFPVYATQPLRQQRIQRTYDPQAPPDEAEQSRLQGSAKRVTALPKDRIAPLAIAGPQTQHMHTLPVAASLVKDKLQVGDDAFVF